MELVWMLSLALIGFFTLVKLTWQDVYNDRMVDMRQVHFLLGAISLMVFVMTYNQGFFSFLLKFGGSILIAFVFTKGLNLGEPDRDLITAMILLFAMYEWQLAGVFSVILLISTILYLGYKKLTWKKLPQPYLPVILVTWILTNVIMFFPTVLNFLPFRIL